MIKIITAPDETQIFSANITLFLAGGITNCRNWQNELIQKFQNYPEQLNLTIFNPRRQDFPINDPNASFQQIKWQFNRIKQSKIFSMFFCGDTTSDQPICFYQLGKELGLRKENNFDNVIITAQKNFKRYNDVFIQTQLMSNSGLNVYSNIDQHFNAIINVYKMIDNELLKGVWAI